MVHGPCGGLNRNFPCMKDDKSTKRYQKPFLKEKVTGDDGYPKFRCRSLEQ